MKGFIQFSEERYGGTLGIFESVESRRNARARRNAAVRLQESNKQDALKIEQKSQETSVHLQENQ